MSEVTFGDNLSRKLDSHLAKTMKNDEFFVLFDISANQTEQARRLIPPTHMQPPAVWPRTTRADASPAALSTPRPKVQESGLF